MQTLGMIGGTSWHSTIAYYKAINEGVAQIIGSQGNPPLIIHSLNIEIMRSRNWDLINTTYLDIAKKLETAGAHGLIICANTPHVVYDFVQPQIGIPILHIAEATGQAAQHQQLQTLGLLGNKPTMTGDFIKGYLQTHFNLHTLIPEGDALEISNSFVSNELTQGQFSKEAKNWYLLEIEKMKQRGAEGIILGCTELPLLIKTGDVDLPLLSTTDLHCQMAVDFILQE